MTVIPLPAEVLGRKSTWAAKHLEFMETSVSLTRSHLEQMSDAQIIVECRELVVICQHVGASEGGVILLGIYNDECARRGLNDDLGMGGAGDIAF